MTTKWASTSTIVWKKTQKLQSTTPDSSQIKKKKFWTHLVQCIFVEVHVNYATKSCPTFVAVAANVKSTCDFLQQFSSTFVFVVVNIRRDLFTLMLSNNTTKCSLILSCHYCGIKKYFKRFLIYFHADIVRASLRWVFDDSRLPQFLRTKSFLNVAILVAALRVGFNRRFWFSRGSFVAGRF